MADASGAQESTRIMNLLLRSTLDRGALFRPHKGGRSPAKLRARSLRQLLLRMEKGARLAVVWRYGYSDDLKLWEGVVERWLGLWRIRCTERLRETLPFPPLSPLIVLCAARVFKPFSLSSGKKRHRKSRALSGKRALHDSEGPRGPALKGKLNVATLNVTSLKLKGEDEFSLIKCGHLYEVFNFMNMKGINILGMQETRYRFSSSEKSEVLCRKVQYRNSEYFFNLITARAKDAYNGMGIVSSMPMSKVFRVSKGSWLVNLRWKTELGQLLMFMLLQEILRNSRYQHFTEI